MTFELLNLDSELFGFKVAKISAPTLPFTQLKKLLLTLKSMQVHLVYWQCSQDNGISKYAAQQLSRFLASEQIIYSSNLEKIQLQPWDTSRVEPYGKKKPAAEMYALAVKIGELSRFGRDDKISQRLLEKMYHTWIENSVNRSIADEVLVIREHGTVIGMVTLGIKNGRGNLGLVAIAGNHGGKQWGSKLVLAAQRYFLQRNCKMLQVVTQKTNHIACKLYEKCGFTIEKIDNFYHFWL